jgi:hypothetical protein
MLAYNLGNFLRRLTLPEAVKEWSLRSVQLKLITDPDINLLSQRGVRLYSHA